MNLIPMLAQVEPSGASWLNAGKAKTNIISSTSVRFMFARFGNMSMDVNDRRILMRWQETMQSGYRKCILLMKYG